MCDNFTTADRVQIHIAKATMQVDAALQTVRRLKATVLADLQTRQPESILQEQLDTLHRIVNNLLNLHRPDSRAMSYCDHCRANYPCPTLRILNQLDTTDEEMTIAGINDNE
jgi:hypothetical protein